MSQLICSGFGTATADAELKTVGENKTQVATVNMAFNAKQQNSTASFLRVQVWGKRAEIFSSMVKKGLSFFVSGILSQQTWKDNKTGDNRSTFVLNVSEFDINGSSGGSGSSSPKTKKNYKKTTKVAVASPQVDDDDCDEIDNSDLPF